MIRSRFNLKPTQGLKFEAPSLVQSQFAANADINIMLRRALGGDMSVFVGAGHSVDVSDCPESMHDVCNIVARANNAWDSMPDSLKRTFGNSAAFIEWFEKSKFVKPVDVVEPVEPVEPSRSSADTSTTVTPSGVEPSMAKSVQTT